MAVRLEIGDVLTRAPVIPVLTINKTQDAAPLARALVAGGLPVIEVTLRSDPAVAAIAAVRAAVPGALVGAGTVTDTTQLDAALAAGAQFIVSPGFSEPLCTRARERGVPMLPGVATATELMAALAAGFNAVKFFPAAAAGGIAMLKALGPPFPTARFCPTGGIDIDAAGEYLALPNVLCVGMSSVAPPALVENGDFAAISALARRAAALRSAR